AEDDFSDGRARVKVGDNYGYIDTSGNLVIQPIFSRGWNFKQGICIVEYHDKLGVINLKGNYILKPEYDFIKIAESRKIILCRQKDLSIAYDVNGAPLSQIADGKMSDSDGRIISVRNGDHMY